MSVRLMAEVFELPIPPGPKLLLLALADFASDDGTNVFPSVDRMARKSSVSVRMAQYYLADFRQRKVMIEVEPPGWHKPACYRLDLRPLKGATIAPFVEPRVQPIAVEGCNQTQEKGATHCIQSVRRDPLVRDPLDTPASDDAGFSRLWKAWPRKKAKKEALKVYASLRKRGKLPTVEALLLAVERQSPEWMAAEPQYRPHMATWLRGERWGDEESGGSASIPEEHWAEVLGKKKKR